MSNARSPRDVCSTTIGTSGLTVLASFRVWRPNPSRREAHWLPARLGASLAIGRCRKSGVSTPGQPRSGAGRPELPRAALGLAAGCPELVARLRLLDADRGCRAGQQIERVALRELRLEGVQAPGG